MRMLVLLCALSCAVGVISGCAGSHAPRVHCERHLTPINGGTAARRVRR